MLESLIYVSNALIDKDSLEMTDLLHTSIGNNSRNGITGALAFTSSAFFQLIEGEPDMIDTLFARIEQDSRHRDVRVLLREPMAARRFAAWDMKMVDAERDAELGRLFAYDQLCAADVGGIDRRLTLLDRY